MIEATETAQRLSRTHKRTTWMGLRCRVNFGLHTCTLPGSTQPVSRHKGLVRFMCLRKRLDVDQRGCIAQSNTEVS